ncbi:MAG: BamA/TamA family outer membrane protein [Bacteroidales bacterium]|nr:BamA/TamA family outer membrane protein [Bacteroidales bacterium]
MFDNVGYRKIENGLYRVAIAAMCIVVMVACSLTKKVADGEMLLDKVEITGNIGKMDRAEMMEYVGQRPNVRVLGLWRLGLHVYNLAGERETGWNNWLRTIGSAPVIYDSLVTAKSSEQLKFYADSKGYFDSAVRDTLIRISDKKCIVRYIVDAGEVYRVARLGYYVADDSLRDIIMSDTAHCLIKSGAAFDSNVHDEERTRIVRKLQENGYFHFTKESIYFMADSASGRHLINDSLIVLNDYDESTNLTTLPHRKSIIDDVNFYVNKSGEKAKSTTESGWNSLDNPTGYNILFADKPIFSSKLTDNSCFIKPGQTFRLSDIELTQRRFNSLSLFNNVSVKLNEKPDSDSLKTTREPRHLICDIGLTTANLQSYSVDLEGTNSSGNLGGAISLSYKHNNLFHNSEALDIKLRFAMQNQFARDGKQRFATLETGLDMSLRFPNVIAPFVSSEFNRKRNPSTIISLSFDYQRRPDFTKKSIASKAVYEWQGSIDARHSITPIEIDIINIPSISKEFNDYISNTYLQYSYRDHLIMSLNYTFVFNQQKRRKTGTAWYVRTSAETAGNILSAALNKKEKKDGAKEFLGISFAQYVKADVEVSLHQSDIWDNQFVWRLYTGVGVPYGNSKVLPFEKSYFVGGANSIRAWPVRGLGPGSSKTDRKLRYHNQIGDIRIEMNGEYRFKMVSVLEGAIFADAGNIWSLSKSTDSEEAIMTKKFWKQIALGAGIGFRLNFDYFVIRVDAASKMHDPSADGNKWVIAHERYKWSKINWNFAIGYPF